MRDSYLLTLPITYAVDGDTVIVRDESVGVLLKATVSRDGTWTARSWVLPSSVTDEATAMLALEVLSSTEPAHRVDVVSLPDGTEPFTIDQVCLTEAGRASAGGETFRCSMRSLVDRIRLDADVEPLIRRVPGLTITQAGGAAPFQADGTWHGHPVYFRYRHGWAHLRVGGDDVVSYPLWEAGATVGDQLDGWLDPGDFVDVFCRLAADLQPAQFPFRFQVLDADGAPAPEPFARRPGTPAVRYALAMTVEDAYALAQQQAPGLTLDPTPLERDERQWPHGVDRFVVLPG